MTAYRNLIEMGVAAAPGAGEIVLAAAVLGQDEFGADADGLAFDCLFRDGFDWELASDCIYDHARHTLSRGSLVKSSTGARLDLGAHAVVAHVLMAERIHALATAPGSSELALLTDYADLRYAYLGYASRICRIDYASYPAVIQNATTSDLDTDWPNRETLIYA